LHAFTDLEVLVIGECMLDRYLEGSCKRLSPEAPVPIVSELETADVPGGAANTAVTVRGSGAATHLLSVVGDDAEGRAVCQQLKARGLTTDNVIRVPGRRTVTKQRIMSQGQLLLRLDSGTTTDLDSQSEAQLLAQLR